MELLRTGDFNTDVEVIMGTNSAEGVIMVYRAILNGSEWGSYARDWANSGPRALFNIADPRNVRPENVELAERALQFYVGTPDEINAGLSSRAVNK